MISGHFLQKHAALCFSSPPTLTELERNTHMLKPLMDSSEVTSANNLQTGKEVYNKYTTFYLYSPEIFQTLL